MTCFSFPISQGRCTGAMRVHASAELDSTGSTFTEIPSSYPVLRHCQAILASCYSIRRWLGTPVPSSYCRLDRYEFQSPTRPSSWTLPSKCWTVLASTPRSTSAARADSMSGTTSCRPCSDPGVAVPMAIEQAEPGGVSCTMRFVSLMRVSWSTMKPTCSL